MTSTKTSVLWGNMGRKVSKAGVRYPNSKNIPNKEYWAARRAKAVKKGVCASHPSQPVVPGITKCKKCVDAYKSSINHRKQNGLCMSHGGVPSVPGKFYCQECLDAKRLNWLRRVGLEEVEIDRAKQALLSFDGRCQVCVKSEPGLKGWILDHDHNTGKFRGILCSNCNLALGHLKDDVFILKSLIVYLKRSETELEEK